MTFRKVWVEALKRAGAPNAFLQSELKRDSVIPCKAVDSELEFNEGRTAEGLISELTEIFRNKQNISTFSNWLCRRIDDQNRRN